MGSSWLECPPVYPSSLFPSPSFAADVVPATVNMPLSRVGVTVTMPSNSSWDHKPHPLPLLHNDAMLTEKSFYVSKKQSDADPDLSIDMAFFKAR